jgi:PAS domain S-box-containing protein
MPGGNFHHDLNQFDLNDMIACGRSIRDLAQEASSMESAARLLVNYFREALVDPKTGQANCALVRCFKTHRMKQLPLDLYTKAQGLVTDKQNLSEEVLCLTLLATAGDLPEWNDRTSSTSHAVIPLESAEVIAQAPMISQLIHQMGVDIHTMLSTNTELLIQADERAYGVFHVERAVDSPLIPAQSFVLQHGIQSTLGFGGLLPSGDLFALIAFSRAGISRQTADLFRTIALSVKLILLPFTRGPIFAHEPAAVIKGSALRSFEQEQNRSEIATLRLLIPAMEEAAIYQTSRLKDVVTNLQLQAEEVKTLGDRLGSVLESTTDAVCMLDRQWNFTYLNRHAVVLLQTNAELLGANIWEAFPAAVSSEYWHHYHRAMDERMPSKFEEHYPEPVDRWFEVHAYPNQEGIAVFFRDVTDRRNAEAVLIKNEKLAAVGRLAASIAHEINNPLESVTNLLYLAQRTANLDEVQRYLGMADRELRRVGAITTQTLRFHRQSSRPTLLATEELIDDVLSIYQGRIVNSRISVHTKKSVCRPIRCFEGEIRQVMNNLVGNAIDAMHPDGGRLLLRNREGTDWQSRRRGVAITVADTGPGMSPHIQSKAFEPFFTTKGIGGAGLGLWISRGIIDRHRGRIKLRSREKEGRSGTVFTLFLPFEHENTNESR